MEPSIIVDMVDEARKMVHDIGERLERHRVDAFNLQRLHKALRLGVVVRIPTPPHRADETMSREKLAIGPSRVLGAAVGVMKSAGRRFSTLDGGAEGSQRQPGVDGSADGIADDAARPGIEYHCHVGEPANDREWSKKRFRASPPRTVRAPFSAYGSPFKLGPWPWQRRNVASLCCISLIIRGLHLIRSVNMHFKQLELLPFAM